jgi:hypothetical protein
MSNLFGVIPITEEQNLIIKTILFKFNNYASRRGDPKFFESIKSDMGTLTEKQWEMVDEFSKPREERLTVLELTNDLGKKSISSVQKPRDQARKKLIEAILTVALVLQDESILLEFISDVL